jgi:2Fe-2S ferredoxin
LLELAGAVGREEEEERAAAAAAVGGGGGRRRQRPFVRLRFDIPHHSTCFDGIKWRLGESLLDVARNHPEELGEYMEGTCGGQMSCCTCHLYLPGAFAARLEASGLGVSEAEQDMLDLAYDPLPDRSRLGCQVVLTESVLKELLEEAPGPSGGIDEGSHGEALTITVPPGVNNVWK